MPVGNHVMQVERLARELGVTLDTRAVVDPRAGVTQLLRPLEQAVSRMKVGPGDSMMELVPRQFVATLHDFAAGGGSARDPAGTAAARMSAIDRVATALIRPTSSAGFRPRAVHFQHPAPGSIASHQRYFGCPVHFASDRDALFISTEALARPNHLAEGLLRESRYTVSDVAFLTGFSEQSAFNRAFKRWSGQTPTAYRRAGHVV